MTHETLGIAVALFAPSVSREGNLADIADLAPVAVVRGAGVVVNPEYSSYFVDSSFPRLPRTLKTWTGRLCMR